MHLSTHYYVISLSEHEIAFYEAFRDEIIDIRNGGFPVDVSFGINSAVNSNDPAERMRGALRNVDQHFGECYRNDPLRVVVTGEKELQDLFASITAHRSIIIGRVEGDYSATSIRDLGKIVWPVVKESLSGLLQDSMHELEIALGAGRTVSGLKAVSQQAVAGTVATLLVEDDFHVRGSINNTGRSLEISQEVDVLEEIDDAVDGVIEIVLESGGKVIFVPNGSLHKLERIVLLLRESEDS